MVSGLVLCSKPWAQTDMPRLATAYARHLYQTASPPFVSTPPKMNLLRAMADTTPTGTVCQPRVDRQTGSRRENYHVGLDRHDLLLASGSKKQLWPCVH